MDAKPIELLGDRTVEVYEFWYRDWRTGWVDHWWSVPELDLKYGDKYPMVPEHG